MKIGIVGSGEEKFTRETARMAQRTIEHLLAPRWDPGVTVERRKARARWEEEVRPPVQLLPELVSGRSPMGGVDLWAEDVAVEAGLQGHIYPFSTGVWDGPGGFKERNLTIARVSDEVHVVVVRDYPPGFRGQRFEGCYHCAKAPIQGGPVHVKSGACWTAWRAWELGKDVRWHVLVLGPPYPRTETWSPGVRPVSLVLEEE